MTSQSSRETRELPKVYASRPPYDDGWMWVVGSAAGDHMYRAREMVLCGDNLTFHSALTDLFLATRSYKGDVFVVPSFHVRGEGDLWRVVCRSGPSWRRDEHIQLRNIRHGCYLSTSVRWPSPGTRVGVYNVSCGPLSDATVWMASEGIYFKHVAPIVDTFEDEA